MPTINLRWYQIEAVNALVESLKNKKYPLAVLPTGSGKTLIICEFVKRLLNDDNHVLILSHVFEILKQNYAALNEYQLPHPIGLYSKGLNSTTITPITVAGIQSVHKSPELFKHFSIILIDECHLIPMRSDTMYRSFLSSVNASYVGLTATPYRTNHGLLTEGNGALFNCIAYQLDDYQRLIKEGYLSQLITKNTYQKLNPNLSLDTIRTTAGDFNIKDLGDAFDRKKITDKAIDEIIQYGKNLKLWVIFAINIEHANHINDTLKEKGINSVVVHSKLNKFDRASIIDNIKNKGYQAVVNINILTTGFDAPHIDLIAMLRPTKSPVLHVQAIGRGLRVAPGKKFCLVMDFAGNTERLGPIDNIIIQKQDEMRGHTKCLSNPLKECPECLTLNPIVSTNCIFCDHLFKKAEEKITKHASDSKLFSDMEKKSLQKWINVAGVSYSLHYKKGSKTSMRVTYHTEGLSKFSEWVCYDHDGWAGREGKKWVKKRWLNKDKKMPLNVYELTSNAKHLTRPSQIFVNNAGKYATVIKYEF
jgi:DNA repair protein RadD